MGSEAPLQKISTRVALRAQTDGSLISSDKATNGFAMTLHQTTVAVELDARSSTLSWIQQYDRKLNWCPQPYRLSPAVLPS